MHTSHTTQDLPIGTEIYYTGDMANHDGFGTVTAVNPPSRFCAGGDVDITMADGREFRGVAPVQFNPAPGRRFWKRDDWQADRQQRIAAMQTQWQRLEATAKAGD